MSTKKSSVITHLVSKKHGNGKDKLKSKLKDHTIMEAKANSLLAAMRDSGSVNQEIA